MRFRTLLAIALCFCGGCREHRSDFTPPPTPTPEPIQVFKQFTAGNDFQYVLDKLGITDAPIRYRAGGDPDQFSALVFVENGNVHIDARHEGEHWVLRNVPFFEFASGTADERVAAWDSAADPQQIKGRSDR